MVKTWFLVKIGFSVQDWGSVGTVRVRYCFLFIKVLIKIEVPGCVWGDREHSTQSKMMLLIRDHCVDNIVAFILSGPLIVNIYAEIIKTPKIPSCSHAAVVALKRCRLGWKMGLLTLASCVKGIEFTRDDAAL